jgi:hypothetical protein
MSKKEIVIVISVVCAIGFLIFKIVTLAKEEVHERRLETESQEHNASWNGYSWQDQEIEEMKYRVYFGKSTGHGPNSIFVVNVTKDKLEVQALQKQLK